MGRRLDMYNGGELGAALNSRPGECGDDARLE
jgi:hypothetical protein